MPKFEQDITVDAPVDKVWAMITNPGSWGLWFPGADTVSGLAKVEAGATFQYQQGTDSATGSIIEVDDARGLIKLVTADDGKQVTHTIDLDRTGGFFGLGGNDTKVKYIREYDTPGGFIGEFVTGGNPVDALAVKAVLERLKQAVQG
jgi:uncharacterized protein YndB with AHSA1/START domain